MAKSNYVRKPIIQINENNEIRGGWDNIVEELKAKDSQVLVCELYPGVDKKEVLSNLRALKFDLIIKTEDLLKAESELYKQFHENITFDRVFGFMSHKNIDYCFDMKKLSIAQEKVLATTGKVLIIGEGASLVSMKGLLLYCDLSRWEIQLRYRKGLSNWLTSTAKDPILAKFKQGYFVEWRIADRHKMNLFEDIDYFIDTHKKNSPKMVEGTSLRSGLKKAAKAPFRMEPYFDEGVWGGQWMKEKFGLSQKATNYAWSFDGVPEENSINLGFGRETIKLPAIDLVLYQPHEILGEKVHGRYGAEFPIRFDLLDTMGGGNLSLQVHPLTEYIQQEFGMNYTQDESYYILDTKEDGKVYLGVKENIDKEQMITDLKAAKYGENPFEVERYVNSFPAHKHDHFLISGGTIHCSGKNTVVLEISATPYIFTFKLWDWGRLGLDGRPRPLHIEHGEENIQWDRDTTWVKNNLVGQESLITETEDYKAVKTGLHVREPIVTTRYSVKTSIVVTMNDSVNMLNLVEGKRAIIESLDNSFTPFEVHYAETFIVPAFVKSYKIVAPDKEEIKVIKAEIR